MDRERFTALLRCHSTPGDEDEVRDWLTADWTAAGWTVRLHGRYGISAARPEADPEAPLLLVAAHMDSPGYAVAEIDGDTVTCIRMGAPRFPGCQAEAVLKSGRRRLPVTIRKDGGNDRDAQFSFTCRARVRPGDRLCFRAAPYWLGTDGLLSPFLDNRVGCYILSELANDQRLQQRLPVRLMLAATAMEEMSGFGASVLARELSPDLAVCLDATYASDGQEVLLGAGPVLTLSDASVILSTRQRDVVARLAQRNGVPLQTEVYNYSGTDARAFPEQGVSAPVLALLVASEGNHSPVERIALSDVEATLRLLRAWARDRCAMATLRAAFA